MTQPERPVKKSGPTVGMYETPENAKRSGLGRSAADNGGRASDFQLLWQAVLIGLFTALSTLYGFSFIGNAIGLATYDATGPFSSFGTGIWGVVSIVLAFGIGGYMAAKTAAPAGRNTALLNASLVWLVAMPILLFLLSRGLGGWFGMAAENVGRTALGTALWLGLGAVAAVLGGLIGARSRVA